MAPAARAIATTESASSSGLKRMGVHPSACMVMAGGWRNTRPRAVLYSTESVKEEATAGHQLHGVDSRCRAAWR